MCLAMQGKEEALACIEAIKQNAISYGSVLCLAEDIERSLVANMASGDAGIGAGGGGMAVPQSAPHLITAGMAPPDSALGVDGVGLFHDVAFARS